MTLTTITTPTTERAEDALLDRLTTLLQSGKKVLWLVSGGSGGSVCAQVAMKLKDVPFEHLFVTLTDERYGELDHANENWHLLKEQGFELPGAHLYRPLIGVSREETAQAMNRWFVETTQIVEYTIGLFGIGEDGHTAGLKPHCSALESKKYVAAYTGSDFERITITPHFIEEIDEAIIQAFGTAKFPVLKQYINEELPPARQPAQLLKDIPKATLYTDYQTN